MTTRSVLKLKVNNHAGVMSHVCGLFSRRAYNLEGILVLPIESDNNQHSCMWLLVNEGDKLDQVISQTRKLLDVLELDCVDYQGSVFEQLMDDNALQGV